MTDRRMFLHAATALTLAALIQLPTTALAQSVGYDVSGVLQDDTLAARVPARIREAGVLIIGLDNAYAPWEYLGG